MNKALKIILIVAGSICALIGAFVIIVSIYVYIDGKRNAQSEITTDKEELTAETSYDMDDEDDEKEQEAHSKTIPGKEELASGIPDYLHNIDQEHRNALMAEATQKGYPVNWPMLWIVVKRVNMDSYDVNGKMKHFDIEMSDEEADYLLNEMSKRFTETVYEYTNGLVNVEITPLLYDEVTYMDKDGDYDNDDLMVCLDENSFPDIKETFSKYNTIMSTVRIRTEDGDEMYAGWSGLSYTDLTEGNYGFAMAQTSFIPSYEEPSLLCKSDGNPVPEEVYIHEWIHTFEGFETVMKDCDGNPDTAEAHGYERLTKIEENGFYEFYRDLLTRNVWDDKKNDYVGMDEELWRTLAMLMDIAKGRVEGL